MLPADIIEKKLNFFEKIVFYITTFFIRTTFFIKLTLNDMIGSLLGFIIAVGIAFDYTAIGRAYVALTLVIIFCLKVDNHIRSDSRTFDMISTIFSPVNVGTPMKKIIVHSFLSQTKTLLTLILLDVIKILSGIYCVVVLSYEVEVGVFLVYCVIALLFLESAIGIMVYSILLVLGTFRRDFYMQWLKWMAQIYLKDIVKCIVSCDPPRIIMEFEELNHY